VLGLTATATKTTCASIVTHLSIPDGQQGVIKDVPLPNNLILSVSRDEFRDQALVTLLQGKRFMSCQSIIIYCTRRDECERLARLIRTCLQV
jgi:ATP-dependent DNA helicase Q4